jgi:hypothetical protein
MEVKNKEEEATVCLGTDLVKNWILGKLSDAGQSVVTMLFWQFAAGGAEKGRKSNKINRIWLVHRSKCVRAAETGDHPQRL